jgi:hypothetical protein
MQAFLVLVTACLYTTLALALAQLLLVQQQSQPQAR